MFIIMLEFDMPIKIYRMSVLLAGISILTPALGMSTQEAQGAKVNKKIDKNKEKIEDIKGKLPPYQKKLLQELQKSKKVQEKAGIVVEKTDQFGNFLASSNFFTNASQFFPFANVNAALGILNNIVAVFGKGVQFFAGRKVALTQLTEEFDHLHELDAATGSFTKIAELTEKLDKKQGLQETQNLQSEIHEEEKRLDGCLDALRKKFINKMIFELEPQLQVIRNNDAEAVTKYKKGIEDEIDLTNKNIATVGKDLKKSFPGTKNRALLKGQFARQKNHLTMLKERLNSFEELQTIGIAEGTQKLQDLKKGMADLKGSCTTKEHSDKVAQSKKPTLEGLQKKVDKLSEEVKKIEEKLGIPKT